MIAVVFRNMDRSELAFQTANDRLSEVLERFPDARGCRVVATLSTDNSPRQAGPDLFRVQLRIEQGRYKGIILQKAATSLFVALADLCESLLERLNRSGDKSRVVQRQKARRPYVYKSKEKE